MTQRLRAVTDLWVSEHHRLRPTASQPVLPASAPVRLADTSGQTITGRHFSDVAGIAVMLERCSDITISRCSFSSVGSAVIAVDCTNITVIDCTARTITGPHGGVYRGNFVQFDKVRGGVIGHNEVLTEGDTSDPEDLVSLYKSHNVTVIGNWLQGGGPSTSGSGIMVGDQGGTGTLVEGNVCIDTGQVGIGVAGGDGITVRGNRAYGTKRAISNVGIYVWNQSGLPDGLVTVENNRSLWTRHDGVANHWWKGSPVRDAGGNVWGDPSMARLPRIR